VQVDESGEGSRDDIPKVQRASVTGVVGPAEARTVRVIAVGPKDLKAQLGGIAGWHPWNRSNARKTQLLRSNPPWVVLQWTAQHQVLRVAAPLHSQPQDAGACPALP
jgi:hypothetical protein